MNGSVRPTVTFERVRAAAACGVASVLCWAVLIAGAFELLR